MYRCDVELSLLYCLLHATLFGLMTILFFVETCTDCILPVVNSQRIGLFD